MKYLISFILLISILNAKAQKKISLDLFFNTGAVFSKSAPVLKKTSGFTTYDPNTGTFTVIPGVSKTTNEYKNILSPKVSIGVKATHSVNQNFKIYADLAVSFLKAKRKNTLFFPGFSANSNLAYTTTEIFNFYTLDIGLGSSYNYKKWSLNLGFTPSFILKSKLTEIKSPKDPEIQPITNQDPQLSTDNETKNFILLSISPVYQLTKKLQVGLEYNHALTKSYSSNAYSSDVYQSMKASSLDFKIFYKLNQ
ncbi:outer membrane beta-barrel protein [Ferruginibacter sp.]|nr:outer membrane beta-barrel protein [Ferruginibacter sp.]